MISPLRDGTNSVQLVAIADPVKTDFRDVVKGYLSQLVYRPILARYIILHTRL